MPALPTINALLKNSGNFKNTAICETDEVYACTSSIGAKPKKLQLYFFSVLLWVGLASLAGTTSQAQTAGKTGEANTPQLLTGNEPEVNSTQKKEVPQKDLGDVINSLLHKKPSVDKSEDSITKPVFSFIAGLSYSVQTKMAYTASGNCVFRTAPEANLSTITVGAIYTQKHQFSMPLESSIWSKHNTWNFVGDYRYYNYPQSTYGLGSRSHAQTEDYMKFKFLRFYETALRRVAGNFYAGAGIIADFHSKVTFQEGPHLPIPVRGRNKDTANRPSMNYERYGAAKQTTSAGFTLNLLCDTRDNAINASKGTYLNVQYRQTLTAFGSTRPWQSLIVEARKYLHLRQSKNVLALWSYNWLILGGKPPYLDLPSTSWDAFGNTGRGYVQGRFRGTKMIYGEAEYRFGITRNGLIGGVAFANAQTLSGGPKTQLQTIRPGYGAGIRIKLNKLSRTNIAVDYGRGVQGSGGVFMTVGELF